MCFLTVGFLTVVTTVSAFQFTAAVLVLVLLVFLWGRERRYLSLQLNDLEDGIARRTGGNWEDFHIHRKFGDVELRPTLFHGWIFSERMLWMAIALYVGTLRILGDYLATRGS
jgi:hypothetical protein